jgi:flagellar biosynthesis/type III secretory pathway protein FliH
MLLSSNVIKQVSYELENCSIYPRTKLTKVEQETSEVLSSELEITDLDRANIEAESVLINAQQEADRMLQQARGKISALEEEAYARGFQQGEKDAREALRKDREDFLASTRNILNELEKIKDNIYRDTEADLIDLAIKMAEKMVCRQLDILPDTSIDMIKEACNQVRDCKEVILYVPARQFENIVAKQGEINDLLYKTEHFSIRSDPDMKHGGCRIETEQCDIDARLETMAEQMSKLFKGDVA